MQLPVRARRSRRDPSEDAAQSGSRLALNRDAVDAVASVLGTDWAAQPPWLQELLDRVVAKSHDRRSPSTGRWSAVPDKTNRDWLFGQISAIQGCEQVLAFREAICGQYEIRPNSCKSRVCANCERSRSAELVRVYRAVFEEVAARRRSFVVLTQRNCVRLAPGLDAISVAVRSLRGRALFRGGRCRWRERAGTPGHPCKAAFCSRWSSGRHRADRNCPDFTHLPVIGGVVTTEVTFNTEARTWHPHVNLLLDAPFIAQAELADTWRAITCSDPHHRRAGWCPIGCEEGSSVVWIRQVDPSSVREAIKYVTKSSDLVEGDDPTQLVEFLCATRGRRMVQGFGSFYGLQLEEQDDEETVTLRVEIPGGHDAAGLPLVRRYRLPRFCHQCGQDTLIDAELCTYEAPVIAPRGEVRLRNGFASWRPRVRGGPS